MYYNPIQPSEESSRAVGGEVLDALSVLGIPQRMLTGGLTEGLEGAIRGAAGQTYSFEDMLKADPELAVAYLAITGASAPEDIDKYNTIWDIFGDPTNLSGVGLARNAIIREGTEGLLTGAPSNTVKNYYGKMAEDVFPRGLDFGSVHKSVQEGKGIPTKVKREGELVDLTPEEQAQAALAFKRGLRGYKVTQWTDKLVNDLLKGVPLPNKMREKVSKAASGNLEQQSLTGLKGLGLAGWLAQSGNDALKTALSPTARATFLDTGIQPTAQRYITDALESGKLQEAMAQPQHVLHSIMLQGGDVSKVAPELQEALKRMSVKGSGYQDLSFENYFDTIKDVPTATYRTPKGQTRRRKVSEEVVENLWDKALSAWKVADDPKRPWKILVKEVRGDTGNHLQDVARKSRGVSVASKVFEANPKGFKSVEALEASLRKALPRRMVDGKEVGRKIDKGAKVLGSDAGGVYVQNGTVHSASYTEGGVNSIMYVRPDGTSETIISDVYDFMEKNPVGKTFEDSMTNRLLTITPPISLNLRLRGTADNTPYKIKNKRSQPDFTVDELSAIANLRPTDKTLAKEVGRQGLLTGIIANENIDEER